MDIKLNPSKGLKFTLNEDGVSYSVTGIGDCTDTNIVIPATYEGKPVTNIKQGVFAFCTSLIDINIPDSITSIGYHAFFDCESLTSINIPNSVTSIWSGAFSDCTSLKSVHITDLEAWCNISFNAYNANPCHYGADLYLNGEKLTELVIPDTVTAINNYAFYGCTSLTSVTIPNSVTSIGDWAFAYCSALTDIYYDGTPEQFYRLSVHAGIPQNTNIHFSDEKCCTMGELIQHFDIGDEIRE